jgi:hypothetical protein
VAFCLKTSFLSSVEIVPSVAVPRFASRSGAISTRPAWTAAQITKLDLPMPQPLCFLCGLLFKIFFSFFCRNRAFCRSSPFCFLFQCHFDPTRPVRRSDHETRPVNAPKPLCFLCDLLFKKSSPLSSVEILAAFCIVRECLPATADELRSANLILFRLKSLRLLILFAALLVLVFFFCWIGFHSFIRSDSFREWLSKKVSRAIHAEGQFAELNWEGSSFRSAGFSAKGIGKSKLRSLQITNLSAHLDWWQLLKGTWVIDQISADKVEAVIGKKPATLPSPAVELPKQPSGFKLPDFLPSELRIEHLYIASANLHWETNHGETGQFTGAKVSATQSGPDQWEIEAKGGNARHADYPELHVEEMHASVNQESVMIRDAKAQTAGGGEIQVMGKVATRHQLNTRLSADFSDLEANTIMPEEWRVGGKISGHLVYTGDLDRFEHGEIAGSIKITGAAFDMANLFATLHQLAKFGGLDEVRIDSIETHIRYQESELQLSDLRASYQDQIRIEGAGSLAPDHLSGNLLLGLSPKILGWIPGAEETVFTEQRDGLHWTTVKISGTPKQPKEDLTKRLISAFRDRMTKEFKGKKEDAIKSLLDMFHR